MEETIWRQRPRVDWLKSGDRNTQFFHERAKTQIPLSSNKKNDCLDEIYNSDEFCKYFGSLQERTIIFIIKVRHYKMINNNQRRNSSLSQLPLN